MATHVFATDKPAKVKYHVEEVPTKEMAEDTIAHIKPKVDADRWEITAGDTRTGVEPTWDRKAHLRNEKPNAWKE